MFKEGQSKRITKGEDGLWHCINGDYSHERYQSVIGHLGTHNIEPRKKRGPNRKPIDPLDLTLTQLILRLEEAELERDKAKRALTNERMRSAKIRAALSAFMQVEED